MLQERSRSDDTWHEAVFSTRGETKRDWRLEPIADPYVLGSFFIVTFTFLITIHILQIQYSNSDLH